MATSFKQSPVLLYLIILLGFVLGFLYTSQTDPTASVPVVPARDQLTTLQGLANLKIDYSLLTSSQFQQLQVFGELPVQPQGGGKDDPFR
ncbi:MAG TPA: hypothetical protein VMJ72_00850 [Candidatus Paceibacterota bacterium]|nr:hypothetical protein [Candidatus Paceibacterota bacterium]